MYPKVYTEMTLERRVRVFHEPNTFRKIESAYQFYNIFSVELKHELSKTQSRTIKEMMNKKQFNLKELKKTIDAAITSIDNESQNL
jgi:outer membrane lipopolysaccharide assembly protein LptE/RlpB